MENKALFELLRTGLSIPVAYQSFKRKTSVPYILFIQTGDRNFGADDRVYQRYNNYQIELYDNNKNFELEKKLEDLLDENEIFWRKSGDIRIEEENLTEVIYYI